MLQRKRKAEEVNLHSIYEELDRDDSPATIDEAQHRMIAETAYLIAEQRCFQGDAALDDWLQAESEVKSRLSKAS